MNIYLAILYLGWAAYLFIDPRHYELAASGFAIASALCLHKEKS